MVTASTPSRGEIEGAGRDQQRQRGVEAAGEAQHHPSDAGVLQATRQPRGLQRQHLAAAVVRGVRVLGDEGLGVDGAQQAVRSGGRNRRQRDATVRCLELVDAVGEGRLAVTIDQQPLGVDVGYDQLAVTPKALTLDDQRAVLGDQQVPAEHHVGGRLVDAGVGQHVRGEGAPRLLPHQLASVLGLADAVGGGRGVEQHRRPRQGMPAARRDRRPQVLAHLDRQADPRLVLEGEEQLGGEGDALAAQRHLVPGGVA